MLLEFYIIEEEYEFHIVKVYSMHRSVRKNLRPFKNCNVNKLQTILKRIYHETQFVLGLKYIQFEILNAFLCKHAQL